MDLPVEDMGGKQVEIRENDKHMFVFRDVSFAYSGQADHFGWKDRRFLLRRQHICPESSFADCRSL